MKTILMNLGEIITWVVAIALMLFVFMMFVKNNNTKSFYKRISKGQLCSFFIGVDRNVGRIFDIENEIIKVEFIDIDNVVNIKCLNINEIYPPA